jgi:hypothetical protein
MGAVRKKRKGDCSGGLQEQVAITPIEAETWFHGTIHVIAHGVGEIGWLTAWVVIQPLYENAPDIST